MSVSPSPLSPIDADAINGTLNTPTTSSSLPDDLSSPFSSINPTESPFLSASPSLLSLTLSSLSAPAHRHRSSCPSRRSSPAQHPGTRSHATRPLSSPCSRRAYLATVNSPSQPFAVPVVVVAHTGARPHSTPATVPTLFVNRSPSVEPHRNTRPAIRTNRRSYAVRRRRDRAAHQLDHPRPMPSPVRAVFARPWPCLASPRSDPSVHHKVEDNPNVFITPKSWFELIHEFGNYLLWNIVIWNSCV
jgi:hypothetical protein